MRAGATLVCVDVCESVEFYELLDGEWIEAREIPFRAGLPARADAYNCDVAVGVYCHDHPWCDAVDPTARPEESLPPLPRK